MIADGRPHLLYTGVNGPHQLPCLAEAADQDLNQWTRDPGNPVIGRPPPGEAVRVFRDHSAWRDGPVWYQVVGGGLADRGGALLLYRSADLRTWEYAGVFAAAADYGLDGWIREGLDELTGPDRSRVGVMSLPRELIVDSGGALRSRPARELDGARRELVVSRLVHGRGSAGVALAARSGQAAEFSITPAARDATAVAVICHRDGAYDRLDVDVPGRPRALPGRASLTGWSCGSKA